MKCAIDTKLRIVEFELNEGQIAKILDRKTGKVEIVANSDHGKVIDDLVSQYVELFGRAAREACREAAAPLIAGLPAAEVPSSLK